MNGDILAAYARLLVEFGANVQEGQIVRVRAFTGQEEAARAVAAAAYMRGARFVDVWYFDPTPNPRTFCSFANETTAYPAIIPHEAAASSRRRPAIPATPGAEGPARAGNPRLSPLRPQAIRPACHAGGRGFESRRSRPIEMPANRRFVLSQQAPNLASWPEPWPKR